MIKYSVKNQIKNILNIGKINSNIYTENNNGDKFRILESMKTCTDK